MNFKLTNSNKIALLMGISLIASTSLVFVPAIPQDPAYHQFADQRTILDIPHFLNVISNFMFLLVGYLGTKFLISDENHDLVSELYWPYLTFFIGVLTVGIGSSYYHLAPTNNTLIWDRLPMTIAIMAFFTIILSECFSIKFGRLIFIPSLILGIFSVWYWHVTEQQGQGDLRLYGLVQFLPIFLIPLILLNFPSRHSDTRYFWYLLGLYVIAKVFEVLDLQIYGLLSVISGHSIKHIVAGLGCYFIYVQLKNRKHTNSIH